MPGLALIEVAGLNPGGLDVKREGLGRGEIGCVALGANPGFGAAKIKGKGQLVIVPGTGRSGNCSGSGSG